MAGTAPAAQTTTTEQEEEGERNKKKMYKFYFLCATFVLWNSCSWSRCVLREKFRFLLKTISFIRSQTISNLVCNVFVYVCVSFWWLTLSKNALMKTCISQWHDQINVSYLISRIGLFLHCTGSLSVLFFLFSQRTRSHIKIEAVNFELVYKLKKFESRIRIKCCIAVTCC